MTSMLLVAENVEMAVGGVHLLKPVSVTLEGGAAVAVRGRNGAGKTTLLRVVAGILSPSKGSVLVNGDRIDERSPRFRRAVAALIGLPPLARDLTLEEHLALVGLSWGRSRGEAEQTALELLDCLGLRRLRQRFPHELSSGQTQLFAVATVLSRPSDLLVLDEPEQRLDDEHLPLVADLINERVAEGAAVLFATHSEPLVGLMRAESLMLVDPDDAHRN